MLSIRSRRLVRGGLGTLVGVLVLPLIGSAPAGAQQDARGSAKAVAMTATRLPARRLHLRVHRPHARGAHHGHPQLGHQEDA
ncbi:hypothetical protein ACRJ4W_38840 [Streptomyces sp. GLT-R25]